MYGPPLRRGMNSSAKGAIHVDEMDLVKWLGRKRTDHRTTGQRNVGHTFSLQRPDEKPRPIIIGWAFVKLSDLLRMQKWAKQFACKNDSSNWRSCNLSLLQTFTSNSIHRRKTSQ